MKPKETKDIDQIFADGTLIDRALEQAAVEASRRHKEKGVPLVIYRDGKMVLVPADDLLERDVEQDSQLDDIYGET